MDAVRVLVTLMLAIQVQGLRVNQIVNVSVEDVLSRIPQQDVLGPLISGINSFMTSTHDRVIGGGPYGDECKVTLMKFGGDELTYSMRPRGYCSFCCKLGKLSRHIRLYFFSKSTGNRTIEINMSKNKGSLRSAGVKSDVPTVFFIHGFLEYGLGMSARFIRDAFLSREEDYNIISVDWGVFTPLPWYYHAASHTKLLGKVLAKFIDFYHSTGELSIGRIHVIGFSLGAHVAGVIGNQLGQGRLPRITGLDPAFTLFPVDEDPANRLTKDDAEFVDVIHTDAGSFGYPVSIGHVDFYPNGGSGVQPGCEISSLAEKKIIEQIIYCGHIRAWKYYGESVRNPRAFPATKTKIIQNGDGKFKFVTDAYMGFGVNSSARGDFGLITNAFPPFGMTDKEQETEINTL
ncbi:endothelial lipase-like [Photinus pyralis]|uniref:endothelial lipase-like n=1 Tax=Photinus pyralis TaxID=7054 RepID=UPI0012672736|nr:endothelial lipase-like [Photinus pyralis]